VRAGPGFRGDGGLSGQARIRQYPPGVLYCADFAANLRKIARSALILNATPGLELASANTASDKAM
jgi:hypothetical protein